MKKMKKMIAVILTLVLCLGMSNLSVFAAEGDIVDNTGSVIVEETDNNTPDNTGTPAGGTVEGEGNGSQGNVQQPVEGENQLDDDQQIGEDDNASNNEMVTLTYDANADEDEVTGLPAGDTVEKGQQVTIKSYRNMKRQGYTIYGWSVNPNATWPDNDLRLGDRYTLTENTTFYAVWVKDKAPDPEVPEGAMLRTITVKPDFYVEQDGKYRRMQGIPIVQYDYSYEYGGTTYTGTTTAEELGFGMCSSNQVLKVLVANNGEPTKVTLTMRGHEVTGYKWFQQQLNYTASGWESVSQTAEATMSVTNTSYTSVYNYSFYRIDTGIPDDKTVTNRDVDIVVGFMTPEFKNLISPDKANENYAITYSYKDVEGNTVSKTLYAKDAEKYFSPVYDRDDLTQWEHFKWTVNVPVIGDGIYLTMTQSNYDIEDPSYAWVGVVGTVERVDAVNIGKLYVSKENNPVTPYIYNAYAKQYTVTYVDGVEGSAFANQSIKVAEGSATPAFEGTPTREGYTFTGWSPAIADKVTGDVTYTAQWSRNYIPPIITDPTDPVDPTDPDDPDNPGVEIEDPDTPLGPGPDEPVVDIDDPDTPLAPAPDEPVTEIDEEDTPLSNTPKTGDDFQLWTWIALVMASGTGLAWLALTDRKRKNAVK